jgi:hypothetical protein
MTYSKPKDEWLESDPFSYIKLYEAGYSVGGYQDDDGKERFVLYQVGRGKNAEFTKVHDFETLQELQIMTKLLIEGGM